MYYTQMYIVWMLSCGIKNDLSSSTFSLSFKLDYSWLVAIDLHRAPFGYQLEDFSSFFLQSTPLW